MNISKSEQRVLHVLALGGAVRFTRAGNGKITSVTCITREGHVLDDCTLPVFTRLKTRGFVKSRNGAPYRITRRGTKAVRAEANQR